MADNFDDWCPSGVRFDNKIQIGIVKDGRLVSAFSIDDLYYKALCYASRWAENTPKRKGKIQHEVSQKIMQDGWAIPISHTGGIVYYFLIEDGKAFLTSVWADSPWYTVSGPK
jgi:hypothetical protein